MKFDIMAQESQFLNHMAPLWHALAPDERGSVLLGYGLTTQAAELGLPQHDVPEDPHRPVLVASYGDQKRAVKTGRRVIARMEHGAGQSYLDRNHPSYAGGTGCEAVGLFLCPNEYSADRWRRSYPNARVAVVGCPKLDNLPARLSHPGPVVAFSFHWASRMSPEIVDASAYYKGALRDIAERYETIGHGHPRHVAGLLRLYTRAGIRLVHDFDEVCRLADVYVADNTSTLFEFASTGRPVVVLNTPSMRRDIEHGLRFWAAADVGVQVDQPEDLLDAIAYALSDPPEQRAKREAALDIAYAFRSGGAARAADALREWAASLPAVVYPSFAATIAACRHLTPAERVEAYRRSA